MKLRSLLAGIILAASMPVSGGDAVPGRVPKPVLEEARGGKCVEDTAYMRRNHMKLLMHQRDETVHQGIRTRKYSLNGCIECHASQKNSSVIGSNENFCQSCHSYAAVKIDCFECHAGKPKATAFHPLVATRAKAGLAATMRREMQTGMASTR